MEDILFKGKRVDNGEWVYGWVTTQHKRYSHGKVVTKIQSNTFGEGEYLVDTKTVERYIGLEDVNGKKIFSNDICFYDNKHYQVMCERDMLGGYWAETGYLLVEKGYQYGIPFTDTIDDYFCMICAEVVGNIHDNPELMKV